MSIHIQSLTFSVPLTQQAHDLAESFCSNHSNLFKSEQVYLNTLSVYAVNYYLKCMGFETDWEASDSSDPIAQSFLDVADLEVSDRGRLECRRVSPDAKFVYIPEEVWSARIGYIAVQFDKSLQTATLLGFAEKVTTQELSLDRLRNLAELPEYLQKIRPPIDLNQWFDEVVGAGWQTLETLLATKQMENLALSFKDASQWNGKQIIKRVKQIDFDNQSIILLIALMPEEDERVSIRVRVYPALQETCLPANLRLAILSNSEETRWEVNSRTIDNFIQLPRFTCSPGENFKLTMTLNNILNLTGIQPPKSIYDKGFIGFCNSVKILMKLT